MCAVLSTNVMCAKNEIQNADRDRISQPQDKILDASIISLIASPKAYDNTMVRVTGYMIIEFEGDAVYFHKEDEINKIYKNGLWLDLSNCDRDSLKLINGSYVIIEGVFHSSDLGHLNLFSGAFKSIKRIYPVANSLYGYSTKSVQRENEMIMTDDSAGGSSKISNTIDSIMKESANRKSNFCITPK